MATISTRPTYGPEDATHIVNTAMNTTGKRRLHFRDVVWSLVVHEYNKFGGAEKLRRVGYSPLTESGTEIVLKELHKLALMKKTVDEIIPPDL